jgi:hypothetical protein
MDQGIFHQDIVCPLQLLNHLCPCYLPCFVSRGPRIGGFLHPACYGIPSANNTTKGSRQAVYVPTPVFEGDGLILTSSYAAAYYRGRSASYLARGGISNPVRAFPSQTAAQKFFQNTVPQTVTLPAIVPYIRQQLEHLDLFVETKSGRSPLDPITVEGNAVGRATPALFPFLSSDIHSRCPWSPSPPPDPFIHPGPNCLPDNSLSTMSTTASTVKSTATSTLSNSKERKRSKDRMTDLKISPLLTSGKALSKWVLNLKWSLAGDCWCHEGIHATNIMSTSPSMKSISNDLLSAFKKAVTKHTSSSQQGTARSLLQDRINGVDGMALITQGRGFKMFQQRIKSAQSGKYADRPRAAPRDTTKNILSTCK